MCHKISFLDSRNFQKKKYIYIDLTHIKFNIFRTISVALNKGNLMVQVKIILYCIELYIFILYYIYIYITIL